MSNKLAWGLIGTGAIAKTFCRGLAESTTGELLAVGSRNQETADAFGKEFNAPRCYGSYEAMLADPDVQAVYISTPHPMHAEWAIKSAEAGKHILCEKPIAVNFSEAMAIFDAARRNDVFLMEAFMYRCHPQTAKIVELIRNKAIGDVRVIHATFSFACGFNPESRLFKNALGGGGILDVGCYSVSAARLIAGAGLGLDYAEPIDVSAVGHVGEISGVDEYAVALLKFDNDIAAHVATGVSLNQDNCVRVFGTEGNLFIPNPWMAAQESSFTLTRYGQEPEEIAIKSEFGPYTLEADTVAVSIPKRQAPSPAMNWGDTLGNMHTLDRWRSAIGMVYEVERPESVPTVDRRPLAPREPNNMKYGHIEGVSKPISRLVLGAVGGEQVRASVMYDEFFRSGGNCYDTAHVYGPADQILGQWIKTRGIREQVVVLGKGAHTPFCDPDNLTKQLFESLDHLQTDYLDIYMMHRDNLEIPVGEFVDVLNQHKNAGRIRAFGGSNWTLERVRAANEYAASKGLTGFTAVNNNFSLARMIEAPWDGCIASSDLESRAWFEKTQMPEMSWSSMAQGFFAFGDPKDTSKEMVVRCWYSEDNFQRLERAKELGAKYGVPAVNIALAYVLRQSFPTFALIGPWSLEELRVSLHALDIELTSQEIKWLNLE